MKEKGNINYSVSLNLRFTSKTHIGWWQTVIMGPKNNENQRS